VRARRERGVHQANSAATPYFVAQTFNCGAALLMAMSLAFSEEFDPQIPHLLPHDKVYQIQVGIKLYKLSGASISSDAPSHFSNFFLGPGNADKVLFIDRSPQVFDLIYMHLQGYHVNIRDDYEFIHLYLDSYYYGLQRLLRLLSEEEIYASVGSESFRIHRSLFTQSGNTPNYFTLLIELVLTDNHQIIEKKGMIRPPPQRSLAIPTRLAQLFRDLLELLAGNFTVITSDQHRALLVRECKYYRFLRLEQQIIKHKVINNPFLGLQEIVVGIADLQPRGLVNVSPPDGSRETPMQYCRPHLSHEPLRVLVMQIDAIDPDLHAPFAALTLAINTTTRILLLTVYNRLCERMMQLFRKQVDELETKETLDSLQLQFLVGLRNCKSVVNGKSMKPNWIQDTLYGQGEDDEASEPSRKRSKPDGLGDIVEIKVTRSLWRVMNRGRRMRLHCVYFEGVTDECAFVNETAELL
jgi:hypothetical protein